MDNKLKALLDLIGFSEGTSTSKYTKNNGYDVIVSGINSPHIFTSYTDHPFAHGGFVQVNDHLKSTACGRYQLLAHFWLDYKKLLKLQDFSPASQDAVAIQQIGERHAIAMIEAGNIEGAITACSNIWASFPGNSYGQGGKSMDTLVAHYNSLLEGYNNPPTGISS